MSLSPEISVIIPVFNASEYLCATLESIVKQENILMEVLVVDDHSTDNTRELVEIYSKKYPYIKLLTNEKGKGAAGARNTAMQYMKGDTCFFIDGDDLLVRNVLRPFVDFLKQHDAQMVRGLLHHLCHQRWLYYEDPIKKTSYVEGYPSGSFAQFLYSSKFLKENKLYFPEDIVMADDRSFFSSAFAHSKQIPIFHQYVYLYRINHKVIPASAKYTAAFITHFRHIRRFLTEGGKPEFYDVYLQSQFTYECLRNAYYSIQDSQEAIDFYLNECVEIIADKEDVLSNNLNPYLGNQASNFWKACKERNVKDILQALEQTNILYPIPTSYIGIKENQLKNPYWKLIRLVHRTKNMLINPSNIPKLWYDLGHSKSAQKFLSNS